MKIILTESQLKTIIEGVKLDPEVVKQRFKEYKKIARKYPNPSQLNLDHPKIYAFLRAQGLVDQIFQDRKTYKPDGYWTPENIEKEAKKYSSRSEFYNNNQKAYTKAREYEMLSYLYPQVNYKRFTLDNSLELAKDFVNPADFRNEYPQAYRLLKSADLLKQTFPNNTIVKGRKVKDYSKYDDSEFFNIVKNHIDKFGTVKNSIGLTKEVKKRGLDLDQFKVNLKTKTYTAMSDDELIKTAKDQYNNARHLQLKDGILYRVLRSRGLSKGLFDPRKMFNKHVNTEIPNDPFFKIKKDEDKLDDNRRYKTGFMFTPITEND